jgi:hypothetical protein
MKIKDIFIDEFWGAMLNLKQIIEMDAADRSKAGQPGLHSC